MVVGLDTAFRPYVRVFEVHVPEQKLPAWFPDQADAVRPPFRMKRQRRSIAGHPFAPRMRKFLLQIELDAVL